MSFMRLRCLGRVLLLCFIIKVASKQKYSSLQHSNLNQKLLMLEGNGVEKADEEDYNDNKNSPNVFDVFSRQQVRPFTLNHNFYNGRGNQLPGVELADPLPFEATSDIFRLPHSADDDDLIEQTAWFEDWLWQHKKLKQFLQQQQQQVGDTASHFRIQNDELPFPYAKQRQMPMKDKIAATAKDKSRFFNSQEEDGVSYPQDEIDRILMIGDTNGNGIENVNDDVYYESLYDKKKRVEDEMDTAKSKDEITNSNTESYSEGAYEVKRKKKDYTSDVAFFSDAGSSEGKYQDYVAMDANAAQNTAAEMYKNSENKQKKATDLHLKQKGFIPSISAGAMTNLGDFFRDLSKNVQFTEKSMLGPNERRLLEGDHPLRVLHEHFSKSPGKTLHPDNTAELLQAIRTYRPSQKIRSLVSMTPHGYHGSQFIDPNYMWVGLGKK